MCCDGEAVDVEVWDEVEGAGCEVVAAVLCDDEAVPGPGEAADWVGVAAGCEAEPVDVEASDDRVELEEELSPFVEAAEFGCDEEVCGGAEALVVEAEDEPVWLEDDEAVSVFELDEGWDAAG